MAAQLLKCRNLLGNKCCGHVRLRNISDSNCYWYPVGRSRPDHIDPSATIKDLSLLNFTELVSVSGPHELNELL